MYSPGCVRIPLCRQLLFKGVGGVGAASKVMKGCTALRILLIYIMRLTPHSMSACIQEPLGGGGGGDCHPLGGGGGRMDKRLRGLQPRGSRHTLMYTASETNIH